MNQVNFLDKEKMIYFLNEKLNIPRDAYSLNGGLNDNTYCINQLEDGLWEVYFSERGQKNFPLIFTDEQTAYCAFLILLVSI